MRRVISTINCVIATALIQLVWISVACSFSAFATSPKPPAFIGPAGDISERCQHVNSQLTSEFTFKQSDSFDGYIRQLEGVLIPAFNVLHESYLYADVLADKRLKNTAKQCKKTTSSNINALFGQRRVGMLLERAKPFASNPLQHRVLRKYLSRHNKYSNQQYTEIRSRAKHVSGEFRKQAQIPVDAWFELPLSCRAGLSAEQQQRFVKDDKLRAAITDKHYLTMVSRISNSSCRRSVYQQYQGRHAATNRDNLLELLALREQTAKIRNYPHYADLSLQSTMLKSADNVAEFLDETVKALPEAPAPWDYRYQARVAKQSLLGQTEQNQQSSAFSEVKYLAPTIVKQGLFTLLEQQFALTVEKVTAQTWHPDVEVYQLKSQADDAQLLAVFYLDLHPRDGKYKNNRHRALHRGVTDIQLPSSALVLNLPRKKWTEKHVKSLFHEFGHLLHNVLSSKPYHTVSGIRIERDVVEMPAKWFELLSLTPQLQQQLFGAVFNRDNVDNTNPVLRIRLYKAAMALAYHRQSITKQNIEQINAELASRFWGHAYPQGASSQYSFSHLATYGPRYYSYIWSELMAKRLLADYANKRFNGQQFVQAMFIDNHDGVMQNALSRLYQQPLSLTDIIQWVTHDKAL
ncbi:M3 family metallopeptidase [Thalassotalea ponticola]|uniref:M3 family metallopeptidase n=1 Tax=Thalassotalea ponticola TaxID=1523392 RepID=UPI0025B31E38|nr:M3 family metallopeptidase [Thalassotalea ponticola]MDN3653744.1 M3 family metallopeptidase [Thalassotalea ponticola]